MKGNLFSYNIFFVVVLLAWLAGCKSPTGVAISSIKCDSGNVKSICIPTFRDLAMSPESYDGRNVIISGYLVVDRGILSLYSSDLHYKHYLFQDNVIFIRAPEEVQRKIFDQFGYRYVRIGGSFKKSSNLPSRRYEIGSLFVKGEVTELPDRSDSSRREGWNDVLIDVHDISK